MPNINFLFRNANVGFRFGHFRWDFFAVFPQWPFLKDNPKKWHKISCDSQGLALIYLYCEAISNILMRKKEIHVKFTWKFLHSNFEHQRILFFPKIKRIKNVEML